MNSLSLLIYLASVTTGLKVLLVLSAIVLLILILARLVYWSTECEVRTYHSQAEADYKRSFKVIPNNWCIVVPVLLLLIAVFIPSRETFYLIAASEAGEAVAYSTEGQEILYELTKTIKDQLKGLQTND